MSNPAWFLWAASGKGEQAVNAMDNVNKCPMAEAALALACIALVLSAIAIIKVA